MRPPKQQTASSAYDVGYQKPPKASQFKKGQSGNPRGRPKGAKNLHTELADALNERVTVVENGRRRSVTKREAICRQLTNRSAAGDLGALRLLLPLIEVCEAATDDGQFAFDPATDRALAKALVGRLGQIKGEEGSGSS